LSDTKQQIKKAALCLVDFNYLCPFNAVEEVIGIRVYGFFLRGTI
jgi:hypothetical protein